MNKSEYNKLIGSRILKAMEQLHFNQKMLISKCLERGYEINQSAMSKFLSGSALPILSIVQICDVLELNVSEVLSLDEKVEINIKENLKKNTDFITDASDKVFRGYKGDYFAYFYTTKNEDSIHHATFRLLEDSSTHQITVNFAFKTGEKNEDGKDIEKKYTGPAYYSGPMQTIYCELTSEEIVEKSYLLFHYDFIAYQNLECRLATVITVSSGIRRLPTMHKLLLTKKKLSTDELEYLCGQLKLNNSEILISESAYREFLRDPKLPVKFFEYFGDKETNAERFISSVAKVNYYAFNESLISDSFIPLIDKTKIICLLRKYSSAPRYNKISEKADEIVYKFLQLNKTEGMDEEE